MSNLPAWILNEVQHSGLNSSNILPRVKNSSNFKTLKRNSPNLIIRNSVHHRNSSVIQRSLNPHLNESSFKQRCNNLWSKFDSRISPILEKYSINNLCRKNQINGKLGLSKVSNKETVFRVKERFSKKAEIEDLDFGIQCDISSESSELDRKYDYRDLEYY